MEHLQKLIESMYHTTDNHIPELADQFFSGVTDVCKKFNINLSNIDSIPKDFSMWDKIYLILNQIFNKLESIGKEDTELYIILKSYCKLVCKRKNNLKQIIDMIPKYIIDYYCTHKNNNQNFMIDFLLEISSCNQKFLKRKLNELWVENCKYLHDATPLKPKSHDMDNNQYYLDRIRDELRNIEIDLVQGLYHKLLMFEAVFLQNHKKFVDKKIDTKTGLSRSSMNALHDFEHCSLCWRFIPREKGKGRPYCYWHQFNPASKVSQTAYGRARKMSYNKPALPHSLPEKAVEIYKMFRESFRVKDGNLTLQSWHNALCGKISLLEQKKFPQVDYDLEPVWAVCPNVYRYIKEHGGNAQSPASILEILDPCAPDESEETRKERGCLHQFLAKNFALYRLELALAEAFLSEEYAYKDAHPRGGKRPNSGGARPGAGRKPKKLS